MFNFIKQRLPKRTLVLDLDETLVHTIMPRDGDANHQIASAHVHLRPNAVPFLNIVNSMFDEVVLFTAGSKQYADVVINKYLDPQRKIFMRRFYRDSCTFETDMRTGRMRVVKDLSVLDHPALATHVVMIDDSRDSFIRQQGNGIQIVRWKQANDAVEFGAYPTSSYTLMSLIPSLEARIKQMKTCEWERALNALGDYCLFYCESISRSASVKPVKLCDLVVKQPFTPTFTLGENPTPKAQPLSRTISSIVDFSSHRMSTSSMLNMSSNMISHFISNISNAYHPQLSSP